MVWVAAAMTAVSVGSSIIGGRKAEKAAEKAAKQQAELTGLQRDEEIRQRLVAARQESGAVKANIYASNVQMTGSAKRYARAINYDNMREVAIAKKSKELEQQAIMAGAKGAGDALYYKAAGDAIGFAAGAMASGMTTPAATPASSGFTPKAMPTNNPNINPLGHTTFAPAGTPMNVPMSPVI